MRIFLISNMFPSDKDALFGVFVQNFKVELEKNDVVFSRESLIKGKSPTALKKIKTYLKHYKSIWVNFFSCDYDLIYIHYLTHHIPIFLFLLPFKKQPLIINVHGSDIIGLQKNNFLNFLGKAVLRRMDLLVVPTSYFKTKVLETYSFIDSDKIFISPSGGINKTKFYPKKALNQENVLRLGFVSRFIEEKGWRTFLDALILLGKQQIPFSAVVAGKGPDKDKIINYIAQNHLEKNVDFLGLIEQDKLVDVYNQLDLYIFPTYRAAESLGLTGLEALACGTPVVATNIAGPSTYIISGENGFLFPPQNSEALMKIIKNFSQMTAEQKTALSKAAIESSEPFENGAVAKALHLRLLELI